MKIKLAELDTSYGPTSQQAFSEGFDKGIKETLKAILESGEISFYADKNTYRGTYATKNTLPHQDTEDFSCHISGEYRRFGGKKARELKNKIEQILSEMGS